MLIVAVGILILLLTFVIPRFKDVFEGMDMYDAVVHAVCAGQSAIPSRTHFIDDRYGRRGACVVAFLMIIR